MVDIKDIETYISYGWSIIPVVYKTKKPLISWKEYQNKKTTIEDWEYWLHKNTNINIAVICGKISNNLVAIDIDKEEGIKYFYTITDYPDTPVMITPNGMRFFFTKENIPTTHLHKNNFSISILSEKAITLLPPSTHPSGKFYLWKHLCAPEDVAIKELPNSLIRNPKVASISQYSFKEGNRNINLFKLACALIKYKLPSEKIINTIDYINTNNCIPILDKTEIIKICKSAEKYRYI